MNDREKFKAARDLAERFNDGEITLAQLAEMDAHNLVDVAPIGSPRYRGFDGREAQAGTWHHAYIPIAMQREAGFPLHQE